MGDYNITIFTSFIQAHTQTTHKTCTKKKLSLDTYDTDLEIYYFYSQTMATKKRLV